MYDSIEFILGEQKISNRNLSLGNRKTMMILSRNPLDWGTIASNSDMYIFICIYIIIIIIIFFLNIAARHPFTDI